MSAIGLENFIETLQCLVQLLPKLTWRDIEICAAYFEQVLSVMRTALENQNLLPCDALGDLMILPPAIDAPVDVIKIDAPAPEDPCDPHDPRDPCDPRDPHDPCGDALETETTQTEEELGQNMTENDIMVLQVIVDEDQLKNEEFCENVDLGIPQVVIDTEDNDPSDDLNPMKEEYILTEEAIPTLHQEEVLKKTVDGHVVIKSDHSVCSVCKKRFSSRGNLLAHMRTHAEKRTFSCSFCGKQFVTKMNLQRHERSHTGDKPFECQECFQRFAEKKTLDCHLRRHTGEKPFRCNVCNEAFSQNSTFRFHMMRHTGQKPYSCDVCNASFRQSHQLTVHKRRRHLKKKDFECNVCQRKFATKGDMVRHLRTHSGDRSFVCPLCPAVFTQASSLRTHSAQHASPLPFTCGVCAVGYKTKNGLTSHQHKTGHGENSEGRELMAHLLASHPPDEGIPLVVQEESVECAQ